MMEALLQELQEDVKGLDLKVLPTLRNREDERRREFVENHRGRFTASEFHRLMGYEDRDELPKGAVTYIEEKVVDTLVTEAPPHFTSPDIQWGIDHELEAIRNFTKDRPRNMGKVSRTGEHQEFIRMGDHIGCTPDGRVDYQNSDLVGGVEVKCPKSLIHYRYLKELNAETLKTISKEYWWQIQGGLYVTGWDHWWFISYDPRFEDPAHRLLAFMVPRHEEDIAKLRGRLGMAIAHKRKLLSSLKGSMVLA